MAVPAAGALGGFREAMSCDVCAELYEQTVRTPLVLPCGHTFCRPCLTDIRKSGRFHCPTCRAVHSLEVEALSVNYMVLNILPLCNQFECGTCTTHGDDLRYWCADCDLSLCSICLHSGHTQTHTVKLAQTFVKEQKQKLEGRLNVVFKNIEQRKKELKKGFNDVDAVVVQLFSKNAHLNNTEVAVGDLLDDIRKANDIASVLSYEKVVDELQSKKDLADPDPSGDAIVKKYLSARDKNALLNRTTMASETTEAAITTQSLETLWRAHLMLHVEAHNLNPSIATQKLKKFQRAEKQTQLPRAVMDYGDGRLLLHTLALPASRRLSLQVPHEVFLELGVGDRCLGRVYIRLWCHLRRAQQFLALCMGTMGLSLPGAKASDKVRHIIVFRFAVDNEDDSVCDGLLTGLERGGQHSKPEAEGLVTGMYDSVNGALGYYDGWHGTYGDGRRMGSNEDMAFGICTGAHPGANTNAAFGEVVAGLEVAKEAFQHNPVNEVTITSCGLVLPGLSQQG